MIWCRGINNLRTIPTIDGEAVYADDTAEILTGLPNRRQTAKSGIRPECLNVLITTESVHAEGRERMERLLEWLATGIESHLSGSAQTDILDADDAWSKREVVN